MGREKKDWMKNYLAEKTWQEKKLLGRNKNYSWRNWTGMKKLFDNKKLLSRKTRNKNEKNLTGNK